MMRTQVGIIGAGPAGLLLAQLLHKHGIESVVLESRDRDYVRSRVRAGVQEQGTVDTFIEAGVGKNLLQQRMVHSGVFLNFAGEAHRLSMADLIGEQQVSVYGQRNITCDMIDVREAAGLPLFFEAQATRIEGLEEDAPKIHYTINGREQTLECEFVAGCDGYHGISRHAIPQHLQKTFTYEYPYSWFAVLAEAPPANHEVMYAHHRDGFALQSMRSPRISRLYIQCDNGVDADTWSDDMFFNEFEKRIQYRVNRGPIIQKAVAPMRNFISEPMRYKRLFLAGDAAHIVPATGAKGMNLAVADVKLLDKALVQFYTTGSEELLDRYSELALRRVWKVSRFSWWATKTLHVTPGQSEFETNMQIATLRYLTDSKIGGASFVENYVGLPYDF
ncbi:MAG: 4-hydroxybenzoate 3-monooxygenase [Chloroflexota bacterium]